MKKSRTRERNLISELEALQATQEDADKVLEMKKKAKAAREAEKMECEENDTAETHMNGKADEEKDEGGGDEGEEEEEEEEETNTKLAKPIPRSPDKLSPTKYERDLIKELLSVQASKGKPAS